MRMTYQVFLELPNGGRLWVTSAPNLKQAKNELTLLSSTQPGTYLIVDAHSKKAVGDLADWQIYFTRAWGILSQEIAGVVDGIGESLTQKHQNTPHAALPE
jgi:hypothetical protein